MSNKTQLQTNNTKLQSLITELQGKAAGGGGSGGSDLLKTGSLEATVSRYGSYIALDSNINWASNALLVLTESGTSNVYFVLKCNENDSGMDDFSLLYQYDSSDSYSQNTIYLVNPVISYDYYLLSF